MSDNDLVVRAAAFAADAHAGDERKGSGLPYFETHLTPVADLVRQSGGDDVQVAAAYLHDAAEDHGGQPMLDRIRTEFGDEVADIVRDLSDSLTDTTDGAEKEVWSVRKQRYLADLATKPVRSLAVSVADKLQNAETTLEDLQRVGIALWQDFNEQRPAAQLWYYTTPSPRCSVIASPTTRSPARWPPRWRRWSARSSRSGLSSAIAGRGARRPTPRSERAR